MRIECPEQSGNFLDLYFSPAGDLVISVEQAGEMGRVRAAVKLFGTGKGEGSPAAQKALLDALTPFAQKGINEIGGNMSGVIDTPARTGCGRNVVDRLVDKQQDKCPHFDIDYCAGGMCAECPVCDRNVFIEHHKFYNTCPRCHGFRVFTSFSGHVSTTQVCNLCGGTGKFPSIQ